MACPESLPHLLSSLSRRKGDHGGLCVQVIRKAKPSEKPFWIPAV